MASLYSEMKNFLMDQRLEFEKLCEERQKIQDEFNDNKIDSKYKQNVLIPKMGEIRHKISEKKTFADIEARKMTDTVKANINKLNDIKGEDLTDDAKLFSCGIKLSEKDIENIIDRNSGNPTMIQLAFRYASENGLGRINRVFDNHSAELQACEDIYSCANTYISRWIDSDDSYNLLNKFFPSEG